MVDPMWVDHMFPGGLVHHTKPLCPGPECLGQRLQLGGAVEAVGGGIGRLAVPCGDRIEAVPL